MYVYIRPKLPNLTTNDQIWPKIPNLAKNDQFAMDKFYFSIQLWAKIMHIKWNERLFGWTIYIVLPFFHNYNYNYIESVK